MNDLSFYFYVIIFLKKLDYFLLLQVVQYLELAKLFLLSGLNQTALRYFSFFNWHECSICRKKPVVGSFFEQRSPSVWPISSVPDEASFLLPVSLFLTALSPSSKLLLPPRSYLNCIFLSPHIINHSCLEQRSLCWFFYRLWALKAELTQLFNEVIGTLTLQMLFICIEVKGSYGLWNSCIQQLPPEQAFFMYCLCYLLGKAGL